MQLRTLLTLGLAVMIAGMGAAPAAALLPPDLPPPIGTQENVCRVSQLEAGGGVCFFQCRAGQTLFVSLNGIQTDINALCGGTSVSCSVGGPPAATCFNTNGPVTSNATGACVVVGQAWLEATCGAA